MASHICVLGHAVWLSVAVQLHWLYMDQNMNSDPTEEQQAANKKRRRLRQWVASSYIGVSGLVLACVGGACLEDELYNIEGCPYTAAIWMTVCGNHGTFRRPSNTAEPVPVCAKNGTPLTLRTCRTTAGAIVLAGALGVMMVLVHLYLQDADRGVHYGWFVGFSVLVVGMTLGSIGISCLRNRCGASHSNSGYQPLLSPTNWCRAWHACAMDHTGSLGSTSAPRPPESS